MGSTKKYTAAFVESELKKMLQQAIMDEDIIFINQLFIKKHFSRQRFSEWKNCFSDNEVISDTIKKVEDLLETRLVVGGLRNKLNATLVIFTLKNKYRWSNQDTTVNSYDFVMKRDYKKYFE